MGVHHASNALISALPVSDGRVTLRPLQRSDLVTHVDLAGVPIEKETCVGVHTTIMQALDGAFEDSATVIAVARAADSGFLGIVLLFDFREREAEIGYWIAPQFRARGYAAAAVELLVRTAYPCGFLRLTARTVADATASIRILRKMGFQPAEGIEGQNGSVISFKLDMVSIAAL